MTISGKEIPAIPDILIEDVDLRNILIALKTLAEIREGRHQDTNQRFITYYELVDYLRGNDQLVVTATQEGHDHATLYSVLGHNHQGVYAEIVHDHNGRYALVVHDHNGFYAALNHDHFQFEELEACAYWQSII